jgi:hypothetical protein
VHVRWLAVVAVVAATTRPAEPCAPAPPPGATVNITDEQAVIVWDAAHHVEHFIRAAGFDSDAKAFGFLVPTPTKPELGELPDTMFFALRDAVEPKLRYESSGIELGCMLAASKSGSPQSIDTAAPSVRVLQTAHVAGYNATTLAADDTAALAGWLASHGFADTPALDAWLQRYVTDHWTITAFVVGGDAAAGRHNLATGAVRMTFSTDRPVYPYREPAATAASASRSLMLYVVSDRRYAATFAQTPWIAKVMFAAPVTLPPELSAIAGTAKFVTAFDDTGVRNGTDEVYFAPSTDPAELHPPDIVIREPRMIPIEGIVCAVLISLAVWLVVRRRR